MESARALRSHGQKAVELLSGTYSLPFFQYRATASQKWNPPDSQSPWKTWRYDRFLKGQIEEDSLNGSPEELSIRY